VRSRLISGAGLVALALVATPEALRVEVLKPIGSLPPHIVGMFEEPIGFQQSPSGGYYVLDRRGQTVYAIDAARRSVTPAHRVGQEQSLVLQPFGFDISPGGGYVVGDVPRGSQQRVQVFDAAGAWLSGFFLPGQPAARIELGTLVLNGVGSIRHAGGTLLISHPESGALFTEYSTRGAAQRSIGLLRPTGFESERDLHLAMNTGLALPDPTGGFYFVFITGRPMFRKYDAQGALLFERSVQGVELDGYLAAQPTRWPRRRIQDREVPYVAPLIRTASVDRQGRLWISLIAPYTYVYDAEGDKTRTLQFTGAGTLAPSSLFFTRDGRLLVTPGCYEFNPG
jgi:hypothetical protein